MVILQVAFIPVIVITIQTSAELWAVVFLQFFDRAMQYMLEPICHQFWLMLYTLLSRCLVKWALHPSVHQEEFQKDSFQRTRKEGGSRRLPGGNRQPTWKTCFQRLSLCPRVPHCHMLKCQQHPFLCTQFMLPVTCPQWHSNPATWHFIVLDNKVKFIAPRGNQSHSLQYWWQIHLIRSYSDSGAAVNILYSLWKSFFFLLPPPYEKRRWEM